MQHPRRLSFVTCPRLSTGIRLSSPAHILPWAFVLFVLPSLACVTLFPPRPRVAWNADASNLVIQAASGGGMMFEPNPMPLARLWGDGRLVWVVGDGTGGRRVLAATLTPDQMRRLLQTFVDDGFFGWKDSYSPGVVYDAPSTCLGVSLTGVSKSVCETLSGAPARFHDLLDLVGSGAGATGADFVPERGYLRVTRLDEAPAARNNGPVTAWPGDQLGLHLADVGDGQWVQGDALRLAWGAVNANPLNPILREGAVEFQVQVLVAGVTGIEPPSP